MKKFSEILEGHEFQALSLGLAAIGSILIAAIGGGVAYSAKKIEAEKMLRLPDSYWKAKEAEAEASVKRHELDISSKERLELDRREREERLCLDERERKTHRLDAQREFEKSAPESYWKAKAAEAEAKAKAEAEVTVAKLKAEADKASAKMNADAIRGATMEIRRALQQA